MTLYWEDVAPGDVREGGRFDFDADGIKDFASKFDPRPTHLDEALAADTFFEGLVASGAHTMAAWARLYFDLTQDLSTQAGVEMRSMRLVRPVRPGDRLSLRFRITEKRAFPLRPEFGMVESFHEVSNQNDRVVLSLEMHALLARRPGAYVSSGRANSGREIERLRKP